MRGKGAGGRSRGSEGQAGRDGDSECVRKIEKERGSEKNE